MSIELIVASVAITCALVLFLVGYVLIRGLPNITWEFLSTSPSYLSERIGILPDLITAPITVCRSPARGL